MSKYIDRDEALEYITFGVVGKEITCGELMRGIESISTIEIVHCKDCIHHQDCEIEFVAQASTEFYCSYGEREE